MPTNDFLPFATAPGANVSTQTDYAALAARTAGFSAGVASSAQINKALRQSSFVAAAVAQLAADNQAGNVLDDGVVANFEAQLLAAIKAAATSLFTGGANVLNASNGWFKLPNGLIVQWGTTLNAAGVTTNATFPATFPNACRNVVGCGYNIAGNVQAYTVINFWNASGFQFNAFYAAGGTAPTVSGTAGAVNCQWFAIGY